MKKALSVILFVILALALSITAFAAGVIDSGYCSEYDGSEVKWSLDTNGTLTISGSGNMRNYAASYGKNWETITGAPWGEYSDYIKSLVIEDGITGIGNYAFAFCDNIVGTVTIPEGVTVIGNSAFRKCSGLTGNIVIPKGVTKICDYAFYCCSGLSGNLIIPDGVKHIGEYAFSGCTGLTGKVALPESVTYFSGYVFPQTAITDIIVSENNMKYASIDGIVYSKDLKLLIACPGGKKGELVIPDGVTSINEGAFYCCCNITGNLVIPDSVTEIGNLAFYKCSGFDGNLYLGKNVSKIEENAFNFCSNLKGNLIVPKNVTNIKQKAFEECGINEYYFCGDAPFVYAADAKEYYTSIASFDKDADMIYYPSDNTTWVIENGKWNGFTAKQWSTKFIYGDVDNDGKINVLDANAIRRCSAKLMELNEKQLAAADVDGNGKVNVLDANLIRRYAAKLINIFPVEE